MIKEFKLKFDADLDGYMKKTYPEFVNYRVLSKSLDARGAPRGRKPEYNYRVEGLEGAQTFRSNRETFLPKTLGTKPLIVGAGPAGLFAALRLQEYGISSLVFERGSRTNERMRKISRYWKKGILDEDTNVCFGEGGAGLYSDGKLITRIKSPHVNYVMKKFVGYGADPSIEYLHNPHLGSNKIRLMITKLTQDLAAQGTALHFDEKVESLIYEGKKVVGVRTNKNEYYGQHIILATGHSSEEIYHELHEQQVSMSAKDFALGVRVEHKRELIDQSQYGEFKDELGAARYRLSYHNAQTERGTYSFCMCPGGYVLSSGTQNGGIVVNGMSNNTFGSPWSNAALVVSIRKDRDFDPDNLFAGLELQKSIEARAYKYSKEKATGRELPAMSVKDFLAGKLSKQPLPVTSSPSKLFAQDLTEILPSFVVEHLKTALRKFESKVPGFATHGVLIAPETRTSAPITILRDPENLVSLSHQGLYPCGEGAGYAGGITSAAVDGIKVAESIIKTL